MLISKIDIRPMHNNEAFDYVKYGLTLSICIDNNRKKCAYFDRRYSTPSLMMLCYKIQYCAKIQKSIRHLQWSLNLF